MCWQSAELCTTLSKRVYGYFGGVLFLLWSKQENIPNKPRFPNLSKLPDFWKSLRNLFVSFDLLFTFYIC